MELPKGLSEAQEEYDNKLPQYYSEKQPEDCGICGCDGREFKESNGEYVCPVCLYEETYLRECDNCGGPVEDFTFSSEEWGFVCNNCETIQYI